MNLVLPTYRLLHSGYDYLGIVLDLYGTVDSDGPEVCDVALQGDKRSLAELFTAKALEDMTEYVARRMDEARRESAAEAKAERALDARAIY